MNHWVKYLLVALVLQLLLLAFFQFSGGSDEAEQPPLLVIDTAAVDAVTLSDSDGNTTSLARDDSAWQLASGLPVDSAKLNGLLEKLAGLALAWPVSTNAATHERFEVSADKFQRRLALQGEGVDETLYFGTSPGHQQVHARGDSDAVYAVKLANFEMPASQDEWLDKTLLQATGETTSVTWDNGVALTLEDAGWMLGGDLADIAGAKAAVDRVAGLTVLGVLEQAPTTAPSDAKTILLRDSDGEFRLSYWPRESNNDHVVMSTRFPGEAFRFANYIAEQLEPDAAELAAPKVPEVTLPGVEASDPETLADEPASEPRL